MVIASRLLIPFVSLTTPRHQDKRLGIFQTMSSKRNIQRLKTSGQRAV